MKYEIIITGSGGQGIQFLGEILAEAAAKEGKEVSLNTSYGAEVKGGKSKTEIIISDEKIDFPGVLEPDIIVLLSEQGLDDLSGIEKDNAIVFFDTLISIENIKSAVSRSIIYYPCSISKIAVDLGNIRSANMVMLGYLAAATHIVMSDSILETIERILIKDKKEKFIEINKKAFQEGFNKAVS